uniref:Uncharacterized protein n=1 Tax=Physcomitrium patens TaxID=3218 RepID=A0A2K1KG12_PHYPA|nr:hypothetical protein PHYPA_009086 [Physcomitrium patens]
MPRGCNQGLSIRQRREPHPSAGRQGVSCRKPRLSVTLFCFILFYFLTQIEVFSIAEEKLLYSIPSQVRPGH